MGIIYLISDPFSADSQLLRSSGSAGASRVDWGPMKYKAIIFDLDGTLIDSIQGIAYSMNLVLQADGFPLHDEGTTMSFVGHGIRRLVEQALPADARTDVRIEECFRRMMATYDEHWDRQMRPYDGIPELLQALLESGGVLSVNTSKDEANARKIVRRFFPAVDFAFIVGRDTAGAAKPDPDGVLYILRQLGLSQEDCLYIGDSEVDLQTAGNAGVDFVAAAWGFRSREQLEAAGATRIVNHPSELLSPAII